MDKNKTFSKMVNKEKTIKITIYDILKDSA